MEDFASFSVSIREEEVLSFLKRVNGTTETDMFRRYLMMEYILGEGTLGTINKVKWITQFIGIRQSLGENYELELNREEKLKQLLDVIS